VPGPGKYDTVSIKSSPRFGFGSGSRPDPVKRSGVPGPGHYKIATLVGTEGYKSTMHSKIESIEHKRSKSVMHPGPGTYEAPLSNRKRDPVWGQGTGKRPDLNSPTVSPGSAAYNPSTEYATKKDPQWKFGSDKRRDLARR